MINKEMIEVVKNRLIATYNPREIYLFGSYAWGMPDDESDLDLLVVVDTLTDTHYKMLVDGHMALSRLNIAKDLLLYSKEEFEEFSSDKLNFCYKIKQKGIKIYAKA